MVTLIGLDFGTTTSSAVVAEARLLASGVTGRMELTQVRERFRSEMVLTPTDGEGRIDEPRIEALLDGWLAAGDVRAEEIFGGGALLTGLTAQAENARALVRLVRRRLGSALIATADDPCLESWLAFMGSCAGLSRSLPDRGVLNLDIGGGTTNVAYGINGEVLRTGCYMVGARHVQVTPGGYRIERLSCYAQALFAQLGIGKGAGDSLTESDVNAILDFYLELLACCLPPPVHPRGGGGAQRHPPPEEPGWGEEIAALHTQVPFVLPASATDLVATFSGGVGELIYANQRGEPWPTTTHFGDLGIDLAQRIAASTVWAEHIRTHQPASAGRATVYGLLRHTTEVSGSTLFLPQPELLPLQDVPILGTWRADSTEAEIRDCLELVQRSRRGGAIQVRLGTHDAAAVRGLGTRVAGVLKSARLAPDRPLILLVRENVGKVLGQYVTQWGKLPLSLVAIDEVAVLDAQYVHIGAPRGQVVPVSFYGLNELEKHREDIDSSA